MSRREVVVNRLQDRYNKEIVAALRKQLGVESVMQVPRLEKVVINVCLGDAVQNPKLVQTAADELTTLTGQKAVITKAKKATSREDVGIHGSFNEFGTSSRS